MLADGMEHPEKEAYASRALELYEKSAPTLAQGDPSEEEIVYAETPEEYGARREAEKTDAFSRRKISEEDMIATGREFIIETYGLTEEQASRMELYTNSFSDGANTWYETVHGAPCFQVEFLLDENPTEADESYMINAYYIVYINVETGAVEQYEYNNGVGRQG